MYDGEWYQGYKQGKGRLITRKHKYSGSWLKDLYHQNGVLVCNEEDGTGGFVYEGDWVMGVMEGMGQLRDSVTADLYIGEFQSGKFNGKVSGLFDFD